MDFQYRFDRVRQFYRRGPHDEASFDAVAREITYPGERRSALVAALRTRNRASASLDLLAQPGTVAVVTGQQVGLFSGPAYTIYKALTAIRLSERLNARGIAAVPIFWLASEDHDFAEVNHAFVFDASHRPTALRVEEDGASQGLSQRPVGAIPVLNPPFDALRSALSEFPFGDDVVETVTRAYRPGVAFSAAFQELLESFAGGRGLLFIDPLDPAIREIAAPFLGSALRQGPDLSALLIERNRELEAAGYHAQVHFEPQTSLFFLLENGRRAALKRQNGEYVSKERRLSVEELAGRPERLSPNALLRPVMQDYLLPTAAYIGGPAELAYLAQSGVLYDRLLGRMPVVASRAGFTLLDARSNKLMERYRLNLPDFFQGDDAVRESIAAKLVPPELLRHFDGARDAVSSSLEHVRGALTRFDPTLAAALDKSRAKMLHQLLKVQQKTARETLLRDRRAGEDARFLSGLIYPEKHLQERYYSILPFLAKHGPDLIERIYQNINLECPDHAVLAV